MICLEQYYYPTEVSNESWSGKYHSYVCSRGLIVIYISHSEISNRWQLLNKHYAFECFTINHSYYTSSSGIIVTPIGLFDISNRWELAIKL